jgi:hypothetical protein
MRLFQLEQLFSVQITGGYQAILAMRRCRRGKANAHRYLQHSSSPTDAGADRRWTAAIRQAPGIRPDKLDPGEQRAKQS